MNRNENSVAAPHGTAEGRAACTPERLRCRIPGDDLLPLLCAFASAGPVEVLVRPLPASVPRTPASNSLQAIIAASYIDYSWSYTPLQMVEGEGSWASTEPRLTCEVRSGVLTVSYLREGFDTTDLPRRAACEREGDRVKYRIRVVSPEEDT